MFWLYEPLVNPDLFLKFLVILLFFWYVENVLIKIFANNSFDALTTYELIVLGLLMNFLKL
jgi:hypothetical protein